MQRIAFLVVVLALSGCGYKTWSTQPFTGGANPNLPVGDSENLLRARGQEPVVEQLITEPGDIWPGPLPPAPTLQDLVSTGGLTRQPEQPVPGSPLSRGLVPGSPSPNPAPGSSVPPGNFQPNPLLTPQQAPPLSSYAAPPVPGPGRGPAGQVIQTPSGPVVTNGGTPAYQTTTTPGGNAIIVPNGNGTSTVIRSDGRIETIPTPK
jgi:hypothetical protein